jgi:hypothetical protein
MRIKRKKKTRKCYLKRKKKATKTTIRRAREINSLNLI